MQVPACHLIPGASQSSVIFGILPVYHAPGTCYVASQQVSSPSLMLGLVLMLKSRRASSAFFSPKTALWAGTSTPSVTRQTSLKAGSASMDSIACKQQSQPHYFSFIFCFFCFTHFYFPASGQAVVTGVVPYPPRFLPSICIAHRVQHPTARRLFIECC